jgi:four helix bundle protein
MKTHKDLKVWQSAIEIVTKVYVITKNFPKEEIYGLTNQIRRAAISIPSNIAEGCGRNSAKELIQFLYYSMGSLSELETQFVIAQNLGYISINDKQSFDQIFQQQFKMLAAFIESIKKTQLTTSNRNS